MNHLQADGTPQQYCDYRVLAERLRADIEYRMRRPLAAVASSLARCVASELDLSDRSCCAGFVRHNLDTDTPSLMFHTTQQSVIEEIARENWSSGLYPIHHVLDCVTSLRATAQQCVCLRLEVSFEDDEAPTLVCSAGTDPDVIQITVNVPKPVHTNVDPLRDYLYSPQRGAFQGLVRNATPRWHGVMSGVKMFCDAVGVEPAGYVYSTLLAGLFDAMRFVLRGSLGNVVHLMLLLARDVGDYATGFWAAGQGVDSIDFKAMRHHLESFRTSLLTCSIGMTPTTELELPRDAQIQAGTVNSFTRHGNSPQSAPYTVVEDIDKEIAPAAARTFFGKGDTGSQAFDFIMAFLANCKLFSDIRHENIPAQVGLVWGNPAMLAFLPDARPIPITRLVNGGVGEWLDQASIVEQHHIIAPPEERCVVVPYDIGHPAECRDRYPAYVVDLASLRQCVAGWRDRYLWSSKTAIYAYLTAIHKGIVAAIAGPDSRVRVFAGGRVVAYRDGKGWWRVDLQARRARVEPSTLMRQLVPVLRMAGQLSRFVHMNQPGCLIVYSKEEPKDGTFEPLHDYEPIMLDDEKWLCGRELLEEDPHDKERLRLVPGVARLAMRVASLDGALCLAGEKCKVVGFGQRINLKPVEGAVGLGGTKRAVARSWACELGPDAFAIAVSA